LLEGGMSKSDAEGLSPLSPGPARGMVAGWDDVGERRCADLHRMRAEPVAMRPRRSAETRARRRGVQS
jgi:hypothetical protein